MKPSFLLIGLTLILLLFLAQDAHASPTSAAHVYTLDVNGSADDVKSTMNLTPVGTWKASGCVIGGCYNLTAASGNQVYTAVPTSDILGTTNRTVKFWAKITGTSGNPYYFSYGTPAATGYFFGLGLWTNQLDFYGQADDIDGTYSMTGTVGVWTMITATYNATSKVLALYVNGTQVQNATLGTALNTASANLTFFDRNGGGTNMDGLLDEMIIDTVAWTPEQVAAVYANESTGTQYPYGATNTATARISPVNGTTAQSLLGHCTATHTAGYNSTFNYTWYVNGAEYTTTLTTENYSSGTEINVSNISYALLGVGANWTLGCIAYGVDGVNSTENNATSTISEYPFPQGFFHGYIFEDNLLDVNGTRNLGAYLWGTYPGVGPPATITYAAGKFGQAANLNGSVLLVNISSLGFATTNNHPVTFSVWLKATNTTYSHLGNSTYGLAFLANIEEDAKGIEHHIYMNYGNNPSYPDYYCPTHPYNISFERTQFGTTDERCSADQQLSETEWTHFVYVYDGATIHGYINGVEVCTKASSFTTGVALTGGVGLGNSYVNPPDSMYAGLMDSFYLYNHTLTGAEVYNLYAATGDYNETPTNNTYWCYQETANTSTACGGLNTGTYSYQTRFLYINYTKPVGALNTSVWQVKEGAGTVYPSNLSLPAGCWNNDPLQFKINSTSVIYSDSSITSYCYNGTGWQTIFNYTYSGFGGYNSASNNNNAIDGNWNTAEFYWPTAWVGATIGGYPIFYEEAMWWEIAYAPNITLSGDNIFDENNYSTGDQYSNQTILLNYSLASDTGISTHTINITRNGVTYYNETTTPITTTYNYLRTLNITTWPTGRYNISINATNVVGGTLKQNYSWYRGNYSYNNPVGVVFGSSSFGLNVSHDASISNINASLSYNGTAQNVSGADNGSSTNFNSTVAMPGGASSVPFSWIVNVTQGGGSSYLFVVNATQTVATVNLTLYFFNQVTKAALTGVNVNVVFVSSSNVTTFSTNTSNLTITNISGGEYTIQYTATGYQPATYNFLFTSGTNQTLNLYLLNSTLASWGQVEVRDFDGTLVEGAVVTLNRYWPDSNTEEVVGSAVTNNLGVTVLAAQVLEAYYKFLVEVEGVVRFESVVPEVLLLGTDGYWSKQITLLALAGKNQSQNHGFAYNFLPMGILMVGSAYDFTASLTSSYWPVVSISWSLYNSSGTLLGTTSSYCTSTCSATIHYTPLVTGPMSGVLTVTTASFTNTYQTDWGVQNVTSEGFTLADAFADITNFNAGGFSGWSRFFISLLVIAMLVLGVTAKTDLLSEPEAALFFVFALTLLFSYVNWLHLEIPGIQLEGLKQYLISIITGLVAGIAVLRKWGVVT